jgi:hypothetical protein
MRKLNEIGRALAAGALVYVVVAACGNKTAEDTAGAGVGVDEAGSDTGSSGGWLDALTDPTTEARAAAPADIVTEPCNVTHPDASPGFVWAVHAYPGKTVNELSAVRALAHIPDMPSSTSGSSLPGYSYHTAQVQLKDGSAAVYCGGNYDSVTFILPN